MKALTLLYHDVVQPDNASASGFPGEDAAIYKLDVQSFDQQFLAASPLTNFKTLPDSLFS
jgi:hypothetical protein